jgi:hypothetical protein
MRFRALALGYLMKAGVIFMPKKPQGAEPTPICGAKAKSTGRPCQRPPVPGRTRCRLHGGATPRGPAHANFKTGRFSADLPTRLLSRYNDARNDPELLSLREETAVVQARIGELAKRLEQNDTGPLWQELREAWQAFQEGDPSKQAEARERIDALIRCGAGEQDAWDELTRAMGEKAKLAKIEWRRLVDMQQVLTAEQASTFALALLDSVLRIVQDSKQRQQISSEFELLLGARQPQEPVSA